MPGIKLTRVFGVATALVALALFVGPAGGRFPLGAAIADSAVDTGENYYAPADLTINAGETVTWTNSGREVHTVTADDNSWGTEDLEPGQSYSYTFTTPGTYPYSCILHDGQTGTITVH